MLYEESPAEIEYNDKQPSKNSPYMHFLTVTIVTSASGASIACKDIWIINLQVVYRWRFLYEST